MLKKIICKIKGHDPIKLIVEMENDSDLIVGIQFRIKKGKRMCRRCDKDLALTPADIAAFKKTFP